jgi:poly(A) polymerase Pap1
MIVWNARTNGRDAQCIMPILTPCYPSMNSSYNVGVAQLRRMQMEFFAASRTLDRIENGEKNWIDLYHGNDFFEQHIHFLQVNISAENSVSFVEWFRFCESRLRLLIAGLEAPDYGLQVFPFAKFFHQRFDEKGQYIGVGKSDPNCRQEASFFVGLRFAYGVETLDLRFCMSEFLHIVNTWVGRRQGMDLTAEIVRKQDLPDFTKPSQITVNNSTDEHAMTENAETESNATSEDNELEESKIETEELSIDDANALDESKIVTEEPFIDVDKGLNSGHMLRKANYATAVLLQVASPSKRLRT